MVLSVRGLLPRHFPDDSFLRLCLFLSRGDSPFERCIYARTCRISSSRMKIGMSTEERRKIERCFRYSNLSRPETRFLVLYYVSWLSRSFRYLLATCRTFFFLHLSLYSFVCKFSLVFQVFLIFFGFTPSKCWQTSLRSFANSSPSPGCLEYIINSIDVFTFFSLFHSFTFQPFAPVNLISNCSAVYLIQAFLSRAS